MRAVSYEIKRNEGESFSDALCRLAPVFEEEYKAVLKSSDITPLLVLDIKSVRGRVRPTTCTRVLQDLKRDSTTDRVRFMAKTKKSVYLFDFRNREFWYNGTEVYITDKEELYLYRRFILQECVQDESRVAADLTRRIGKWFLEDV